MLKLTINELSKYNGLNKKPAYIGYKGKVYDVSKVFQKGEHAGVKAGTDITATLSKGPHQEDIFTNFPVVGKLVTEEGLLEKICRTTSQQADLILRIGLGSIFFAHGAQKLLGWFGGYGWSGTIGYFNSIGISSFIAGLVILIEFFGGLAIILGLFTRPAALGLAVTMLGAAVKIHLANGFFLDAQGPADGIEFILALFVISLYLLVKGSGVISLDRLISSNPK